MASRMSLTHRVSLIDLLDHLETESRTTCHLSNLDVHVIGPFSAGKSRLLAEVIRASVPGVPEPLLPASSLGPETVLPLWISYGDTAKLDLVQAEADGNKVQTAVKESLAAFPDRPATNRLLARHNMARSDARLRLTVPRQELLLNAQTFDTRAAPDELWSVRVIDMPGGYEPEGSSEQPALSEGIACIFVLLPKDMYNADIRSELESVMREMSEMVMAPPSLGIYVTHCDASCAEPLDAFEAELRADFERIMRESGNQDSWHFAVRRVDREFGDATARSALAESFWHDITVGLGTDPTALQHRKRIMLADSWLRECKELFAARLTRHLEVFSAAAAVIRWFEETRRLTSLRRVNLQGLEPAGRIERLWSEWDRFVHGSLAEPHARCRASSGEWDSLKSRSGPWERWFIASFAAHQQDASTCALNLLEHAFQCLQEAAEEVVDGHANTLVVDELARQNLEPALRAASARLACVENEALARYLQPHLGAASEDELIATAISLCCARDAMFGEGGVPPARPHPRDLTLRDVFYALLLDELWSQPGLVNGLSGYRLDDVARLAFGHPLEWVTQQLQRLDGDAHDVSPPMVTGDGPGVTALLFPTPGALSEEELRAASAGVAGEYLLLCRTALIHLFRGELRAAEDNINKAKYRHDDRAFAHHVYGLLRGLQGDATRARKELGLAFKHETLDGVRIRIRRGLRVQRWS